MKSSHMFLLLLLCICAYVLTLTFLSLRVREHEVIYGNTCVLFSQTKLRMNVILSTNTGMEVEEKGNVIEITSLTLNTTLIQINEKNFI